MRKAVELHVEWGDERHQLSVPLRRWRRILAGHQDRIRGKGYIYEGKFFWDYWEFNANGRESLTVYYGADGGEGFVGSWRDALHQQEPPREPAIAATSQGPECPFCDQPTCDHMLALIDETFQEVSGPAGPAFDELACTDEAQGRTSDDVQEFINDCLEVGTLTSSVVEDDRPGASAVVHTFYASDVDAACAKLRQLLLDRREALERKGRLA